MSTAATPNVTAMGSEPDPAREFPGQDASVYLNHAASAPLPRRAAEALRAYLDDRERLFHLYQAGRQDYDPTNLRANLARLANAPLEGIAFVPTTTDGLSGALNGIDWRPGDNVVFGDDEFPSVVYAALALERRGVVPRAVPVRKHLSAADLLNAVDGRTRAVLASHVHWQTGHRIDLAELGAGCRAAGPLSIIDAIQSLGAVPIDFSASGVDVLVAGSYKWLFAIPGAAVLYASERAIEAVTPDRAGWRSMGTSVYDRPRLAWAAGARRFEAGGQPDPTLVALDRSVELLLEIGIDRIYRRAIDAIDRLLAGIDRTGLVLRSSLEPAHRSTIVSVTTGRPAEDDRLTKELATARIIVARRGPGIRIAPHWHNRDRDIDRAIEQLEAAR
jgi:selenocysteine lyase/cysteine desulfurase